MRRPHFHRWSPWESEWEECPDGWMAVYEIRVRHCTRKHCDWTEEEPRCVSLSPEVVRLGGEARRAP